MHRKPRADATETAIETIRKAAGADLSWPLSDAPDEAGAAFFASITAEIPRSEWSSHKLELAAILARTMADHEIETRALRAEGSVIVTPSGAQVRNPRCATVADLLGRILAARRSLGLHAAANGLSASRLARQRQLAREAESILDVHDPDGLLS
ncbi:hypothetical protein [Thermaurantiacus sp.]